MQTTSRKKVLVVDDSDLVRKAVTWPLKERADLSILEADHGIDALDVLERETIDLVLLDLCMPVMDGIAFLEALFARKHINAPPIIVVSTEEDEALLQKARSLGVAHFVTKPVDRQALEQAIDDILG